MNGTNVVPGGCGTGETFVTKIILIELHHEGAIALAVVFSGKATTLLTGGVIPHKMFQNPLQLGSG